MSGFRPGRPFWVVVALMAVLLVAAAAIGAVAFFGSAAPSPAPAVDATLRIVSTGGSGFAWKDVALAAASLGSALVAGAALLVSMWNTDRTMATTEATGRAQRQRETNRAELARLEGLIASFHMPYLVLARSNNNMAQDLRDRLKDPSYRMLVSLFDPKWLPSLPKGDRTLVREICATGVRLRSFIEERAGGVDPALSDHLARASTHFRILWLAYRRRLGDDATPFVRYVYPSQLDRAIKADLDRLETRIAALRAEPETAHEAMPALRLPADAELDPWPHPPRV